MPFAPISPTVPQKSAPGPANRDTLYREIHVRQTAVKSDTFTTRTANVCRRQTNGGQHGQIMAPWPIDENGGRLSDNSIRMKWAVPYGDITTLTNYTSQSAATTDRDSCGNTAKITAKDSADKYPAAWATRKYAPTSATSGKWCLPAAGILTNIYNNLSSVQAAIGKVGGVALLSHGGIWSSSEKDSQNAWMLYVPAGSSFYVHIVSKCLISLYLWIAGPSPAMTERKISPAMTNCCQLDRNSGCGANLCWSAMLSACIS